MRMFLAVATLFVFLISSTHAHTQGTITIDAVTFDRILRRFDTVLVKFDDKFPFGSLQDGFKGLVESVANATDFVVAEIPVTDRDSRENYHFALNHDAIKNDFPVYKLFIKDRPKPINYVGDRSKDSLRRFLLRHTIVWLGLSGTSEVLDRLAREFYDASLDKDENGQKILLEKARDHINKLTDQTEQKNGGYYLKTMETVITQGLEFLKREERRIENLLKGKVSKEKKAEFQQRENILLSFKSLKEAVADASKDNVKEIINTEKDL